MWGGEHACSSMCVRSEESPVGVSSPLHHVGPGEQTQIIRVSSENLLPLSHLIGPCLPSFFLNENLVKKKKKICKLLFGLVIKITRGT